MNKQPVSWLVLGLLLGAVLAIPVLSVQFFDDAYIHARIVENLMIHGEPFFNIGERFKASSSTGYIFLIALISMSFDIIDSIKYIQIVSIIATIAGLFYIVGFSKKSQWQSLVLALSVIPFFLLAAYGGMETPIVCLLLTLAVVAYHFDRHGLVVFLMALIVCFRFEGLLLLFLSIYYFIYVEKKSTAILLYALPVALLFIVEVNIYGSIIPHAAKAKSVAYGYPFIKALLNNLSFGYWRIGYVFGLVLYLTFLANILNIQDIKKLKYSFHDIFFIFAIGIFSAWLVSRSIIFPWYYGLLVFSFGLALLLQEDVKINEMTTMQKWVKLSSYVMLVSLGLMGFIQVYSFNFSNKISTNVRVTRYLDIGQGLYTFCPNCTLVTSEIGGLGYSFKGKVYDAFGLGDPAAIQFHPMKVPEERHDYSVGAIPPKYTEFRKADFIVSLAFFSQAFRDSPLSALYKIYNCPFDSNGSVIWGDNKIQIFSRRDLPLATVERMGCQSKGL